MAPVAPKSPALSLSLRSRVRGKPGQRKLSLSLFRTAAASRAERRDRLHIHLAGGRIRAPVIDSADFPSTRRAFDGTRGRRFRLAAATNKQPLAAAAASSEGQEAGSSRLERILHVPSPSVALPVGELNKSRQ